MPVTCLSHKVKMPPLNQSQQAAAVVPFVNPTSMISKDSCMTTHMLLAPHASSQAGPSPASVQHLTPLLID